MMAMNIFMETVLMMIEYEKKKILAGISEPQPTGVSKDN